MQIHQFVPGMAPGDAVTHHALEIQKSLRQWGVESDIYAPTQHVAPACRPLCRDLYEFPSQNGTDRTLIYHFSIGSEISKFIPHLSGKKVMIYHNITPHTYFLNFNNEKVLAAVAGREQLQELASVMDLALACSQYSREELEAVGFRKTDVLPLFIDREKWGSSTPEWGPKEGIDILFVGRFVPNKKFEDLIKTFYYFQKTLEPKSRLFLVGPTAGFERYLSTLKSMCDSLQLKNVIFTGQVSEVERNRLYSQADLFLCMSEHEGFCLPLLEAMHFETPIVAYQAAAVPETLGGAGILVKQKDFPVIAELIHKVVRDKELKSKIIAQQNERLKDFSRDKVEQKLKDYLGLS